MYYTDFCLPVDSPEIVLVTDNVVLTQIDTPLDLNNLQIRVRRIIDETMSLKPVDLDDITLSYTQDLITSHGTASTMNDEPALLAKSMTLEGKSFVRQHMDALHFVVSVE